MILLPVTQALDQSVIQITSEVQWDLNNGLVQYSNGIKQYNHQMVPYSSHGLKTRLLSDI